jgi:hypothetical protein
MWHLFYARFSERGCPPGRVNSKNSISAIRGSLIFFSECGWNGKVRLTGSREDLRLADTKRLDATVAF